ncbi:hypothetical protein H6G81_18535 [Scytonema hofmannii FACHB-248]|uniref:Uncharacterized protein n=1 Tax=Scytonema hofmannii FACHB-248 TaxID=1842502 RepID=A0ABR8GTK7_9CYAN|nr:MULTISPECIES: hypothetical protein [Nostocales]MBD2606473.1 hypothetical protein [Scytonema hofmannii FACHB-248]
MFNQAIDMVFTDSVAVVINLTLGTLIQSKICNYSWEQKANLSDLTSQDNQSIEETSDRNS